MSDHSTGILLFIGRWVGLGFLIGVAAGVGGCLLWA